MRLCGLATNSRSSPLRVANLKLFNLSRDRECKFLKRVDASVVLLNRVGRAHASAKHFIRAVVDELWQRPSYLPTYLVKRLSFRESFDPHFLTSREVSKSTYSLFNDSLLCNGITVELDEERSYIRGITSKLTRVNRLGRRTALLRSVSIGDRYLTGTNNLCSNRWLCKRYRERRVR